jgi:thiamine kinase
MPSEGPEAVLEPFVPGAGRMVVERLGSGLVNDSYRVMRGGLAYAVRVAAANAAELGLERAWECRVLERAGAAGIAPRAERCDPGRGILVSRWIDGIPWTREEALSPGNIGRMAGLVHRVHELAVSGGPGRRMNPADWVIHYSQPAAAATSVRRFEGTAARFLTRLGALPQAPAVLCHSDLHLANLVVTDRDLVLLDWEYAHVSDRFWDLAGWACNTDMGPEARRAFLCAYLGRAPAAEDEERFEVMAWLYDYVCVLWSEVYVRSRGGDPAAGTVSRRARELTRRLGLDAGGSAR